MCDRAKEIGVRKKMIPKESTKKGAEARPSLVQARPLLSSSSSTVASFVSPPCVFVSYPLFSLISFSVSCRSLFLSHTNREHRGLRNNKTSFYHSVGPRRTLAVRCSVLFFLLLSDQITAGPGEGPSNGEATDSIPAMAPPQEVHF